MFFFKKRFLFFRVIFRRVWFRGYLYVLVLRGVFENVDVDLVSFSWVFGISIEVIFIYIY